MVCHLTEMLGGREGREKGREKGREGKTKGEREGGREGETEAEREKEGWRELLTQVIENMVYTDPLLHRSHCMKKYVHVHYYNVRIYMYMYIHYNNDLPQATHNSDNSLSRSPAVYWPGYACSAILLQHSAAPGPSTPQHRHG